MWSGSSNHVYITIYTVAQGTSTLCHPPMMTEDWVSDDEGPAEVHYQKGIWTASQRSCIRSFAEQWNTEAADRKSILPNIVTALLALPEPPTMQNISSVCSSCICGVVSELMWDS